MSARDALAARFAPPVLLTAAEDMAPYLADDIAGAGGEALAVLRPGTTAELSDALRLAARHGLAIVPRGGGTGFVGGATPATEGAPALVVSLDRMKAIRSLDPVGGTAVVEAGLPLEALDAALAPHDLMLPVRHGGGGSAQVGGTLATNAGGYNVLRHGMARAHVLGLEVVLADGTVWDGLRSLPKDNTGYDLKQLFIGAEGTLGLITAAALRLTPRPTSHATALLAFPTAEAALDAFARLRPRLAELLSAFELFPRAALELGLAEHTAARAPFTPLPEWMVLLELETALPGLDLAAPFEAAIAETMEAGLCEDGLIAQTEAQRTRFWDLREALAVAQAHNPRVMKSDTSVPVAACATFVAQATRAVQEVMPGAVPLPFGHVGDGNIHFNVMAPETMETAAFAAARPALSDVVMQTSARLGGAISAEHGIGRTKREMLRQVKSPVEMDLMTRIKAALDPSGRMNPGKLL